MPASGRWNKLTANNANSKLTFSMLWLSFRSSAEVEIAQQSEPMKNLKFIIGYCLASLCFLGMAKAGSPITLTANFDNLTEGSLGSSFSEGGISFFNLNQLINQPYQPTFDVQMSTTSLPGFSNPNYVTFGGYSPGDALAFGRFGSMSIGFSGTALSASMDIFGSSYDQEANTLTLEAILNGNIVNSDTVTLNGPLVGQIVYQTLSVSGTFNSLELVAAGPENDGADFFGMDNVTVTVVPEPSAGSMVCCGLIGCCLVRWRMRRKSRILYE